MKSLLLIFAVIVLTVVSFLAGIESGVSLILKYLKFKSKVGQDLQLLHETGESVCG
jgi:hypothetical protein